MRDGLSSEVQVQPYILVFVLPLWSSRKEAVQLDREALHRRAGQRSARPVDGVLVKLFALRLVVNFDLFPRCQHQPAFLHAGAGVGAKFGAVILVAAHTDFNDEFGGSGVFGEKVILVAADHREVRLRLGFSTGDGLFLPDETARRFGLLKRAEQALGNKPVEWRLGHFVEDLAVEQFGFLGDKAQVAQRMIGFDAERPNLRATDDWFRCFNDRHGTKVSLRGVAAQVRFPAITFQVTLLQGAD